VEALKEERFVDECDVLIVGGGVAGLSAAIRVAQLAQEEGRECRVVLLEKGSEIGAHVLSGAVIEPSGLDALVPDWREDPDRPLHTKVTKDRTFFLTSSSAFPLPTPPDMHNEGNYIGSLGNVARYLAARAEALGVEVFPGFSGAELIYSDDKSRILGVATADVGIAKDGSVRGSFERGMELRAPVTILAEGCRGSLTGAVETAFDLRAGVQDQTYGIGIKEVWRVPDAQHEEGLVVHSLGWPVDMKTWGGAFMYHWEDNQVSVGYVVGLDYANPYLNPYKTMQQWKTHPKIAQYLKGGECISYGARALNEGGFQAIPKLSFPGGAIVGCAAGFLNVPKIKGSHNAILTGKMAGEAAFDNVVGKADSMDGYETAVRDSSVWREMYQVRNHRPSWTTALGSLGGMAYSGLESFILRGRAPWTFKLKHKDNETLLPAEQCKEPEYPKPDGSLTFDLLTSLSRTGTNHEDNQPPHLRVQDPEADQTSFARFAGPEARFCPAGVYEYVDAPSTPTGKKLQISAQNCIHCKTCSIKGVVPIRWTVPENGGGPAYSNM
jgi:electron-transferring-flavoprotein dehydrogenase